MNGRNLFTMPRELTFVFLTSVACTGTPSFAQEARPTASKAPMATTNTVPVVTKGPLDNRLAAEEAHPAASKPPRATTNTIPAGTKARLDNRLSAEDRRGIFELVRTVYTNSPTSSALTLVAGPEENTVRVWRTANKIANGVAAETITLTKEKGRWKIQSISR